MLSGQPCIITVGGHEWLVKVAINFEHFVVTFIEIVQCPTNFLVTASHS